MKFLSDLLKGIIIGIGAVAPGVSGGTFAVMLGVYDKLTDAIANIFNNIHKKILVLLPLGIGVGIGILGFSKIMKSLFENHEAQVKLLFIGLMLGTIPSIIKAANKRGFKNKYLVPCIFTFCITTVFTILENRVINIIPESQPGLIALLIYGAIIGFGTIVPGISSSFILMYIGAYETLLDGIVSMDLALIIPVGVGFGLSIILFAKLINFLFGRFYGYTYYAVIGFITGSILAILPAIEFTYNFLIGIVFCAIGFWFTYGLSSGIFSTKRKLK